MPVALTGRSRLLGLALLSRGRAGPGLLIPRCSSIHTFGMRFALDLIWLDRDRRPVRVDRAVGPNRFSLCLAARSVVEAGAGTADDFIAAGL